MKLIHSRLQKEAYSERMAHSHQSPSTRKEKLSTQRIMLTEQHSQTDIDIQVHSITANLNLSSIGSLARQAQTIEYRVVDDAEHYLQVNFKPEVNGYLLNKFRKYVASKNSARRKKPSLFGSQLYQESKTVNFDLMENQSHLTCNSCCRSIRKVESNGGMFVQHAKEKILRLVELKKKKEEELQRVASSIKSRSLRTEKKRRQRNMDIVMPQLQKQSWDKAWREGATLQQKRYRTRVMSKNRKSQKVKFRIE